MKIKNIEVGSVVGASGLTNFFGNGYPYHSLLFIALLLTPLWVPLFRLIRHQRIQNQWDMIKARKAESILNQLIMVSNEIPIHPVWFSMNGITHTTKTIVAQVRAGNLKTKKDGVTPREFMPKCIYVDMVKKVAVNNVALSCPGIDALLETGRLQAVTGTIIISIMPVGLTPEERLAEIKYIHRALRHSLGTFRSEVILQINVSCPNTGHDLENYLSEVSAWVGILRGLKIPITAKTNTQTSYEAAVEFAQLFDALFITNSLPYTSLTQVEKNKYFYGMEESPLMKYQNDFNVKGPGGVSGELLLSKVLAYVSELRDRGVRIPIVLGGGILKPQDVDSAKAAGANAISPGSITMIAPWNLGKVVKRAQEIFN